MAAASFTAAKFLAPVAARSGGERAPPLPAGASSSSSFVRTLRRGGAHHPRLRTALAVSSDLLAGNKAAQAAATHPVWNSFSSTLFSPITPERKKSDLAC
jgi:pyruvate dehydrogenase E1 component alpha subunit